MNEKKKRKIVITIYDIDSGPPVLEYKSGNSEEIFDKGKRHEWTTSEKIASSAINFLLSKNNFSYGPEKTEATH